ncbi:sulfite exporter TauE/SafE family protein [Fulvivirga sp. M361]|uniref:sulfite exporter TauE/SafE family protein n=1 Tax=Fulvivirga sp. M361 TaxID=2594266 RepID=UPI001C8783CC|nr:sulfite exporter TauE/SafE family protein [Fulvivirga sp. M361]
MEAVNMVDLLILAGAGIIAGFINVVAGGGSLITLPLLIFMGLPTAVANATNRVAIFSQNIFAVAGFRSKGISAFPYSLYLAISALMGAIIGAKISVDLDDELFNKIIAAVMIMVVVLTIFNPNRKTDGNDERTDVKSTVIGVIVFFFVGIYGGFIQAGIGFIMIAALTGVNRFSLVKTNSAKVFVALVYTSAALVVFIIEDVIDWPHGLALAAGNSTGGWIASRWSVKKGDKWIKRFLIVTVTALAIKLWFF